MSIPHEPVTPSVPVTLERTEEEYLLVPSKDLKDKLSFYNQENLSAEEIIAKRSIKDAQLAEVAPEASAVLSLLMSNVSARTSHPYIVGYFIQSGFVERNVAGWSTLINGPNRIFHGPVKPRGPPFPMPDDTFPHCRCVCDCKVVHLEVCCPWDKVRVHQRIKHYYRGKDDFVDWVELICQRCNKTRAFIPEYMAEKDCVVP